MVERSAFASHPSAALAASAAISPAAPARPDSRLFLVIGRHGRPECDRTIKIGWRAYRDWWRNYDLAGLAKGQAPGSDLLAQAARAPVIFSSNLPRSIETARAAAAGKPVQIDPIFTEAPLPPPPIPGNWTPGAWGVWARLAWWFGRSAGGESRTEAEARAVEAAGRLISAAEQHGGAMLMAHGWFNRMMRPVLLKAGWKCIQDGGDDYWSYRVYVRES